MATVIITKGGMVELDVVESIRRQIKSTVTRYKVERKTDFSPHISSNNEIISIQALLSDATFKPEDPPTTAEDLRKSLLPDFITKILDKSPYKITQLGAITQFQPSIKKKFKVNTPPATGGEARRKMDMLERACKNKETVTLIEGFGVDGSPIAKTTENLVITNIDPERNAQLKNGYSFTLTLEEIRVARTSSVKVAANATPAPEKAATAGGETSAGAEQTKKVDTTKNPFTGKTISTTAFNVGG